MDALEQVRLEICREREEKRRQEAEEYNRKIRSVIIYFYIIYIYIYA